MSAPEAYQIPLREGAVSVEVSSASDVGAVRRVNEDSVLVHPPYFVIADGMGGHLFGDRASRTAVDTIAEAIVGPAPVEPRSVVAAVVGANAAVRRLTDWAEGSFALSGTTLTGVAVVTSDGGASAHWMVVNVGDSRVYALEDGAIRQLTVDHSVVRELVDSGEITADEALDHPERNVVTRALGAHDDVEADVWLLPARGRQGFLVCSDGLTKELRDAEIEAVLAEAATDRADPAERLIAAAIDAGGTDNVSVIVVTAQTRSATPDDDLTRDRSLILDPQHDTPLEDTLPRR